MLLDLPCSGQPKKKKIQRYNFIYIGLGEAKDNKIYICP
jgi:hypothetical protein